MESGRNGGRCVKVRSTYPVQPYGLRITFTDTAKEFNALADGHKATGCGGAFSSGKRTDYVVGVFDRNLMTLIHECVHAASSLLQEVGIDPISNNSEPLAYLVDHLVAVGAKRLKLR